MEYPAEYLRDSKKPHIAKENPIYHNWCGEGVLLSLSKYTAATTTKYDSRYWSNYWIWLGADDSQVTELKIGTVYEVTYQILGYCFGPTTDNADEAGIRIVLVRLLSWKEIK